MNDKIQIGEWYKVEDFEHGVRPVQVTAFVETKPDYFWAKYTDGAVYDFHVTELKEF